MIGWALPQASSYKHTHTHTHRHVRTHTHTHLGKAITPPSLQNYSTACLSFFLKLLLDICAVSEGSSSVFMSEEDQLTGVFLVF